MEFSRFNTIPTKLLTSLNGKSFARIGLTLITVGIAGCATTPLKTENVDLPGRDEAFEVKAPSVDDPAYQWAKGFNDDVLTALIAEALESNIGLEAAKANARAADAAARISGSLKMPSASLGLNSSRQQSRLSFLNFQEIDSESHSLSLGSRWELDLWGKLRKTHASGMANWEAAQADVEALKLSIAGQVGKAWFNVLELDNQWRLAQDSSLSLEQKLSSLEKRYKRGLVTSLDLRLTRAQAASSRAITQQRKTALNNSKRALETLLGRYPSARQNSNQTLPEIANAIPSGLSSALVARRPDLYAAERRLAASLTQSEVANRNWLPQLNLTGSAGTTSDQLTELLDTDFSIWSIAGDLATTVFSGGRLQSERDQAKAQAEAQLAQFRNVALTAFQEVENALSAESELAQLSQDTAIAAYENEKAEDLAWDQYERGIIDITTLLDAQRRADDSASQLISVQNQRLQNRINLHIALGGDFQ
jgi:NodT family efflux transporter outer membrane factor (OMF) lipoprotein